MQILFTSGFSVPERNEYRTVIRKNVIESLQTLVTAARKWNWQFDSPAAIQAAAAVLKLETSHPDFWSQEILAHVETL